MNLPLSVLETKELFKQERSAIEHTQNQKYNIFKPWQKPVLEM